MKFPAAATVFLLGVLSAAAQTLDLSSDRAKASSPVALLSDEAAPWSVVGKWHCVDPAWTDTVTISPDGTFARDQGDTGHWTLSGLQDHLVLVMNWDDWPSGTVTMMGPDEFRGKVRGGGELTMHRIQTPVSEALAVPFEFRTWHHGEPPVRLIRKEEGFCALSLVTGHFQGGGEVVKVYVGEDGYWYLGGQSGQEGVAAQCIVVRYPGK